MRVTVIALSGPLRAIYSFEELCWSDWASTWSRLYHQLSCLGIADLCSAQQRIVCNTALHMPGHCIPL